MSPVDARGHAAHDLDSLSEALDGRLDARRLEAALALARSCPECRAAYEAMAWTRAQASRAVPVEPPSELEAGIRSRLDRERARPPRRLTARGTVGLALAAALVLSFAALLARQASRSPDLVAAVAADHRARAAGRLPLGRETGDPGELESWFASAPLGFAPRVLDLGMMGYELRGGETRIVDGRARAVIVYREIATGREVICEMVLARLSDLGAPHTAREHDGIPFRIYRVEGRTLVFWPEANVLCVLVGPGDPEALVQLAFAKAMKARPHESH